MVIRIGLISDTHGLLRPTALEALAGSDRIIHAGDIGDPAILERLGAIAPVTAVRGNNDFGDWARAIPETDTLRIGRHSIFVIHDEADIRGTPAHGVVVAGHSHRPASVRRDGVLYVNPGSAGPRRFTLPVSIGRLVIDRTSVHAELVELPHG